LASGPAYAEDTPAVDVAGGYSFGRDHDIEENFHGWLAAVTGNFNPWFGITGEVGGNSKKYQVLGSDATLSLYSFMVGPRITARGSSAATPFFQFLVGAVRGSGSFLGSSESSTELALQPGGGVDVWFTSNAGLRVGGDYRRVLATDAGFNEFRFHVGLVFAGGRR
jgi:hypothetical protein